MSAPRRCSSAATRACYLGAAVDIMSTAKKAGASHIAILTAPDQVAREHSRTRNLVCGGVRRGAVRTTWPYLARRIAPQIGRSEIGPKFLNAWNYFDFWEAVVACAVHPHGGAAT